MKGSSLRSGGEAEAQFSTAEGEGAKQKNKRLLLEIYSRLPCVTHFARRLIFVYLKKRWRSSLNQQLGVSS